jgi:hypothetical protein
MRDVANAATAQAQRPTIDENGQADEAGRLALRGPGSRHDRVAAGIGERIGPGVKIADVVCGKPEAGIGHLVAEIAELHHAIQRAIVDEAGCTAGDFDREVRHPAGSVLSRSVDRNRLAGARSGIDRVDAALRQPARDEMRCADTEVLCLDAVKSAKEGGGIDVEVGGIAGTDRKRRGSDRRKGRRAIDCTMP